MIKGSTLGRTCTFEGCERKHLAKGYCKLHYQRLKKHGDPSISLSKHERHGMNNTEEYSIWCNMISRCHNPNSTSFKYYGARGIAVCDECRESFLSFYSDMGARPKGCVIDRIDNDCGYCQNNCHWITQKENVRKSGNTILDVKKASEIRLLFKTGNYTCKELGEMYGVKKSTISAINKWHIWKD